MIALTGATGGIGGRVAARLAGTGAELRLVVRDPARAPELPGATVAQAEYRDGEAMRAALEGAETVFLVSASESRDRREEHFSAVDAAVAAGARRIVYLSFVGADRPDSVFTFGRDHHATEQHVLGTGVAHTFLRSSLYADYVPVFATAEGVIRGPAGDGRVAWIARDDIADVAAAVLAAPEPHEGRAYAMTGPEALTMDETAAVLSRFAGREVVYERETLEQARESRRPSGAPDWEIEGWVTSYAAIAAGEFEAVTDVVADLAGHPPRSLADFLEQNPASYRHLTGG
jgi:NAD(P)H dehydrogenase (quinone)